MNNKIKNGKILLVDDTPSTLNLVRAALEGEGYYVYVATDAKKAIERAKKIAPDLILMDILMPDMDGFETCRRLKTNKLTKEIPVIFMTALDETDNKIKGFKAGGVDYVTKPIEIDEVLARVKIHIALKNIQQQLNSQNQQLQDEISERKRAEKEIRLLNTGLEQRIEERTKKLKKSNQQLKNEINKRRKTEESLRESEELHRITMENISDPVFITDDNGRFTFVGSNIHRSLGYTAEEIKDMGNISKLIKGIHFEPKKLKKNEILQNIEGDIVDKHKKQRNYLVTIKRVSIKGGTILYTCHEITERKKSEKALIKSEEKYKILAENLEDVVLSISMTGKLLYVSPALKEFGGYDAEEEIGNFIGKYFVRKIDLAVALKTISKVATEKISASVEFLFKPRDRKPFYVEVTGKPHIVNNKVVAIMSVMRDISERKQAEEEMQYSNDLLRAIIEAAPVAIIGLDLDGHVHSVWNPAAEKMLGWNAHEVMGKFLPSVPENGLEEFKSFRDLILSGKTLEGVEVVRQRSDGTPIDYSIYASPLYDVNGNITGNIAVLVDITERKKAEKELKESYEIINKSPAVVFLWKNTEGWPVEYVSENVKELFGHGAEEFMSGKVPFASTVHPDDLERVGNEVSTYSREKGRKKFTQEYRIITKNGKTRQIDDWTWIRRNKKGDITHFQGIVLDITEKKLAEKALKESEERFKQVVENAVEWVWEVDANGLYSYASPIVKKILGYKPEEIVGKKHFYDLFHPDDRETAKKAAFKIFAQKQSFLEFPNLNIHKNGKEVWLLTSGIPILDEQGTFLGYRGVDIDITDRKLAEEDLRKSEEKYRTLTENINVGIFRSTPGPKGKYLELNPAMIKMFGYKNKTEFLKMPVASIYQNSEDRLQFSNKLLKKGFVKNEELNLKKKDGTPIICSATALAVKDKTRKILYFDGIVDDITFQKEAEKKLKESLYQKEILLQEVHHRVKNNLMMIISLFHFYTAGFKNKKIEEIFSNIESTIHSMALIHEKLYESDDFSNINFKNYITELFFYLLSFFKLDPSLFMIKINIGKIFMSLKTAIPLGMIINELMSNILKHAFPPSYISQKLKEAEKGDRPCHIFVELSTVGKSKIDGQIETQKYKLVVEDNGIGFPDDLDIKQTKSIGLNLVNKMVDQLEGKFKIDYKDGTIFTIHFTEK